MRKNIVLALVALFFSGCVTYGNSNPGVGVEALEWDKPLSYDLLGDTQGQACEAKLFGWIPLEGGDKGGVVTSSGTGGQGGIGAIISGLAAGKMGAQGAATYNAIEAFKGADFILPIRAKTDKNNYYVYYRECATVTGKAIRIRK